MSYSLDLRERVVAFVREGGGKAGAARRFSVSRKTVYNWLSREPLAPKTQSVLIRSPKPDSGAALHAVVGVTGPRLRLLGDEGQDVGPGL